jgi:hypothetical protein
VKDRIQIRSARGKFVGVICPATFPEAVSKSLYSKPFVGADVSSPTRVNRAFVRQDCHWRAFLGGAK